MTLMKVLACLLTCFQTDRNHSIKGFGKLSKCKVIVIKVQEMWKLKTATVSWLEFLKRSRKELTSTLAKSQVRYP